MGGDGRPGSTGSDSNQTAIDLGTSSLTRMPSPRGTGLTSGVSSGRVRLRFPVLETFAYQFGWAFGSGRRLDDAERRVAREVFTNSLDLDAVRIVTTALAAAPTTLGDYIRTTGPMSNATLIHELTHVWQYQHGGAAYISDSLCAQVAAWASTGSRNAAYDLTGVVLAGKRFSEYTAEQQAMIVETYFSDAAKQADAIYQALMDEVRAQQPVPAATRQRLIYEEGLYGPAPRNDHLPSLPDDRTLPPIMPFFRIDF
jgi:hypothetical protein